MSVGELACTYAALILHDDGIPITVIIVYPFYSAIFVYSVRFVFDFEPILFLQAEKITTLLKAADVSVESYWPSLFAKLCEKKNVEDLIVNVGAGGGGGAVAVTGPAGGASGGAAAAAAPAAEEKKKV